MLEKFEKKLEESASVKNYLMCGKYSLHRTQIFRKTVPKVYLLCGNSLLFKNIIIIYFIKCLEWKKFVASLRHDGLF